LRGRSRIVVLLSEARPGQTGIVDAVDLPEEVSHHLAHLGFLPGAAVEVLRRAPAGDPTVYRIDGIEVGLRSETAQHIQMHLNEPVHTSASPQTRKLDR
jgi:ferrous iron transport protein A